MGDSPEDPPARWLRPRLVHSSPGDPLAAIQMGERNRPSISPRAQSQSIQLSERDAELRRTNATHRDEIARRDMIEKQQRDEIDRLKADQGRSVPR